MIKFIIDNKKILFPFVAMCLAVCLCVGEVYAWFFVSRETKIQTFAMCVVNLDEQSGGIDVSVVGGSGGEVENMLPSSSITVAFKVTNNEASATSYELYLKEYTQSYPQSDLDEPLLDGDVYRVDGLAETKINLDSLGAEFKSNFYSSFRAPITNALSYRLYLAQGEPSGNYYFLSDSVTGAQITNEVLSTGTLLNGIALGAQIEYRFEVWFNPDYQPTAVIDGVTYRIKNSNPLSGQSFQISLGLRKV